MAASSTVRADLTDAGRIANALKLVPPHLHEEAARPCASRAYGEQHCNCRYGSIRNALTVRLPVPA